jgi:hypothetical protein
MKAITQSNLPYQIRRSAIVVTLAIAASVMLTSFTNPVQAQEVCTPPQWSYSLVASRW